ncbi:MAG TPA: DUF2239 family protein [Anaeromyxobacteraceae bacterium]|nr:DUF2239 family protein [Anaeromyxobacteraceae bacterium]
MERAPTFVAFAGARRVAGGSLREVLPVLKRRFDADRSDLVLVFEVETGRQVDFDLRGTLEEALERADPAPRRGPGRPRLGVTSREVTLLPRHWEWLEQRPSGSSGALRRLVEEAARAEPGRARAEAIRAALGRILTALAGDRPGYEEATRALFAGETARLAALVRRWPKDVRALAVERAREAAAAEAGAQGRSAGEALVAELYEAVWSRGDYQAIERLVAPRYAIHADPGDPWEGKTLDRAGYAARVRYSREAFPDLAFTVHELVAARDRVAVRWSAEGTHRGDLRDLPATGRRLGFAGQTFYALADGRVAGHWQVVDRLGFVQQLGRGRAGR